MNLDETVQGEKLMEEVQLLGAVDCEESHLVRDEKILEMLDRIQAFLEVGLVRINFMVHCASPSCGLSLKVLNERNQVSPHPPPAGLS